MNAFLKRNGVWIGFFLLVACMEIVTQGQFLSARNLTNLLRQTSLNGILAAGMTLVILTGGIDLSVGSIVAVAGVLVGISQIHWQWADAGLQGVIGSLALACAFGAFAGVVNGFLISIVQITPFIVTLGMMVIARGLAMIFSGGSSISPLNETLVNLAAEYLSTTLTIFLVALAFAGTIWMVRKRWQDSLFLIVTVAFIFYSFIAYKGFPILALFFFVILAGLAFALNYTTFGRCVYALGSNEKAALWAGVPLTKVKWLVYTIMGLLAGLGGALLAGRLNGADPNAGQLFELDAIASVVIGGTSLTGGVGTMMGSFVGALTIATLNNGMDLLGVPSFYQMVFKGLIIIVAVGIDKSQRS